MRTTSEETERNDRKILEAAMRVFAVRGYSEVNMQDIADEAGMSRGPLYYRYKTKAALFEAALQQSLEELMAEYTRILTQEKPFPDIMREFLRYGTRNLMADRYMLSDLASQAEKDQVPSVEEIMKTYQERFLHSGRDCVAQAIARGELREDTDPDRLMSLVVIFARGLHSIIHEAGLITSQGEINECIEDILYLLQSKYCVAFHGPHQADRECSDVRI